MTDWFSPRRRQSYRWVAVSVAVYVTAGLLALWLWPAPAVPASAADRVVAALLYLRWPALLLLAMVFCLFRLFDTEAAFDALADGESRRFRINHRVLQNSVEQFAIFAPAVLALAGLATTQDTWTLVQIAVTFFTLGRLLFWIGYHVTADARAVGFNMTISTTAIVLATVFWLAGG
jgi:MAPEG family